MNAFQSACKLIIRYCAPNYLMTLSFLCLITFTLSGFQSSPALSEVEEILGEYSRSEYDAALNIVLPLAELGNANSQKAAGHIYIRGTEGTKDYAKALMWFSKAAEQGIVDAQNNIGYLYYGGDNTLKNFSEAFRWFDRSAKNGNPIGQFFVGLMYHRGEGVIQDYVQALTWYRRAALKGFRLAHYHRGLLHSKRKGKPRSFEEAMQWFELFADQVLIDTQIKSIFSKNDGQSVSKEFVAAYIWAYRTANHDKTDAENIRTTIEAELTPDQISEANKPCCK